MPDFLTSPFASAGPIPPLEVLTRLVIAALLGGVVAAIYRLTRPATATTPSFPPTLVLLSVLIAMVTQVIGDSVARAFSLVGALSIVRFRTVVRDTQDTAFVIFAVVVGMASGASDPRVALIGIVVVGAAAFVMRRRQVSGKSTLAGETYLLEVRLVAQADVEATIGPTLDAHLTVRQLSSLSTAKQGVAVDAKYVVRFRVHHTAEELVKALNALHGILGVEVKTPRDVADNDD